MANKSDLTIFTEKLRGLRPTKARIAILQILNNAQTPLSHSEIYIQLKNKFDRTTIYRNLAQLDKGQVLRKIELLDQIWRFELMGKSASHHAHFTCSNCNFLSCVGGETVKKLTNIVLKNKNFRAVQDIMIKGLCDSCCTNN